MRTKMEELLKVEEDKIKEICKTSSRKLTKEDLDNAVKRM